MRQYIGTKIIHAEPAYRCEGKIYPKNGPVPRRMKLEDGYKVVYPDGYASWSPKDVFEEAYRPADGLTFGLAIEAMKKGLKARRRGWNGKNQYIELASAISYKNPAGVVVNAQHDAIGNKAVAFCGTSGVQMGWLASQADMLAEDWEIVEDVAHE